MKKPLIGKSGRHYIHLLVGCRLSLQRLADTHVTLAFEDAQVIPPLSREETDDTDDTENFLRTF